MSVKKGKETIKPFERLEGGSIKGERARLSVVDLLALPDPLRRLLQWMMRQEEVSLTEVAAHTGQDEKVIRTMLDKLVERGFVQKMKVGSEEEARYRICLDPKRGRRLPPEIWQTLEKDG